MLFRSTWEQLQNRFLLGAGSSYTNGSTGGAATVTLTINQIPSHTHTLGADRDAVYSSSGGDWSMHNNSPSGAGYTFYSGSTGGGQAHNNMPPYLVVYMWKRTA